MLPFQDLHSMIAGDGGYVYLNHVYFCVFKVFLKKKLKNYFFILD
jgi:hypothetical protein